MLFTPVCPHSLSFRPLLLPDTSTLAIRVSAESRGPKALKEYFKDLADEGYVFVFQDARGRHKSDGRFVMSRPPRDPKDPKSIDENTDTNDTIDWLLKNVPHNNAWAARDIRSMQRAAAYSSRRFATTPSSSSRFSRPCAPAMSSRRASSRTRSMCLPRSS